MMNRKKSQPRRRLNHEEDVERPVPDDEPHQAEEITEANLDIDREHGGTPYEESRIEQVAGEEVDEGPDDRPRDPEEEADATLSRWAARRSGG